MRGGDLRAAQMTIVGDREIERLVREAFLSRRAFWAAADPGPSLAKPVVAFVRRGPDPFLNRQFEAWLAGPATYVPVYQLLNRLCRAGALPPGEYAVMHHH